MILGAIIGDIVGSVYEFDNIKTTCFPLFSKNSVYTDDSVMTVAVADWLLRDPSHGLEELERSMVSFATRYPHPKGGYGGSFFNWLFCPELLPANDLRGERTKNGKTMGMRDSRRHPYNSYGNGSAMRVSAVGWMFDTVEETERVAKISSEITHNHPEGIKGAQATAAAVFMARMGKTKEEIKSYVENTYGYNLHRTCDEIRPSYRFDESCQGTVPEAIIAFLDSTDFENAIRLAVSLGGDTDTIACITGGIAEAFYGGIPKEIADKTLELLPGEFKSVLEKFNVDLL